MGKTPKQPTNYTRAAQLDELFIELGGSDPQIVIDRIAVRKYNAPGYVPTEVVLSLFRAHWIGKPETSQKSKVTKALTAELSRRVLSWTDSFLYRNNNLGNAAPDPEEASAQMAGKAWEAFLRPSPALTFPECNFGKFLEGRALDYWDELSALKRAKVQTFSEVSPGISEEDGFADEDPAQLIDALREHGTPEQAAELKELYAQARRLMLSELTPEEQAAIVYSVMRELPWTSTKPNEPSVSGLMKVSEDRARYLATRGLKKLMERLK